jgi:hypothetical protein
MKYVECDNCGRKIYMGQQIVQHKMYCGIYCSDNCFLRSAVPERQVLTLDEEVIDNCMTEIKEE